MRCRAKSKQTGERCKAHCVPGWPVCKYHGAGGGPKTPEGFERCKMASWKHGHRSKEAIAEKRRIQVMIQKCDSLLGEFG